jgi:parallel beta-helix repeat protein
VYRILNRPEPQQDGTSITRYDGEARWIAEDYWFPTTQDVVVFRNAGDADMEVTVSSIMTTVPKGAVRTFFNITTITIRATVHKAHQFFTLDCWSSTATGGGSGTSTPEYLTPVNAKGDGVTDDTEAMNAVMTALSAAGGGTMFIKNGTYMINAGNPYNPITSKTCINVPSNVTIRMGPRCILKAIPNALNNYAIFLIRDVTNVRIEGGTLIGERYAHTGDVAGQCGDGIWLEGASNVTVEGTTFKEFWGDGIYTKFGSTNGNTKNVSVSQCNFVANRRQGISICANEGFRVSDCFFDSTQGTDPAAGIDIEPELGGTVKNVNISGCLFKGNKLGIQAQGKSSGTITGNVFDSNTASGIYLADAEGYVITGNTIYGSGSYGLYAIFAVATVISGNNVYSNGSNGIYLLNGSTGSVVTNNRVTANAGFGIALYNSNDCTLADNIATANTLNGLDVEASTGTTISDNKSIANIRSGLNLWKVKETIVSDNQCNNNLQHGIILKGDEAGDTYDVSFSNNRCVGNGQEVTNFYHNMCLQAGVTNGIDKVSLAGNTCRAGVAANKPQYGLLITAGVVNTYLGDNDFRGGGLASDMFDSGTGTITPFSSLVIPDTSIIYSQPSGLPFKWTATDAGVYTLVFQGKAYDLFDRADSATTLGSMNLGGAWSVAQGTWGISSNKAYSVTDVDGDTALIPALATADMDISCIMSGEMGSFTTYRLPQLVGRWVDSSNYIRAYIMGNWVTLEMKFNGANVDMGPSGGVPNVTVNGQDYTFRLVCTGNNVKLYLDGVLKCDYNMTADQITKFSASKIAGIRIGKGGAPTLPARFNNFIVR